MSSKNKGAYQQKLICAFIFAKAKIRFSRDAVHLLLILKKYAKSTENLPLGGLCD